MPSSGWAPSLPAARRLYPPPCAVVSGSSSLRPPHGPPLTGSSAKSLPGPPQATAGSDCRPDGGPAGSEVAKGSGDRLVSWPKAPPATEVGGAGASLSHWMQVAEDGTPSSPAWPGRSNFRALRGPGNHVCRSGS